MSKGDDLAFLLIKAIRENGLQVEDGDILVVAQTLVSKAEGSTIRLSEVKPSPEALRLAEGLGRDAREVEVILSNSVQVLRAKGSLITRTRHGFVCAHSGVDSSNAPPGELLLLPRDPDRSARCLRKKLEEFTGKKLAVIISDTSGRAFRRGVVGYAIGISGIDPMLDYRGKKDLYGRTLKKTLVCIVDAVAAAANLVMGEADEGVPAVLVRGVKYERREKPITEILRPEAEDLFVP